MKIKLTHPALGYLAGQEIDIPDKQAQELIDKEQAVEVELSFSEPEKVTRKVKHE